MGMHQKYEEGHVFLDMVNDAAHEGGQGKDDSFRMALLEALHDIAAAIRKSSHP